MTSILKRLLPRRQPGRPPGPEDLGPWKVAGASVTGSSHERLGQPCQDAHAWAVGSEARLIAAVADGAGSAALGREGAQLAVASAVKYLMGRRQLSDEAVLRIDLTAALEQARDALESEARVRDVDVRELATTLILLVAGPEFIAAAQIGDGATVAADGLDGVAGLTRPQGGEYINETMFLCSPGALESAQFSYRPGPTRAGALFTDGIQMLALKMPEGTPHAPFFGPFFQSLNTAPHADANGKLAAFLRSPRMRARTTDDLTLLMFSLE